MFGPQRRRIQQCAGVPSSQFTQTHTADLGINFFVFQVTSVADLPPPIIQIGPANQTLPLHSLVTLHCKASSPEGEQPKIRWHKDGSVISAEHPLERYTINPTGTLDIDGKATFFS